MPNPPVGTVFFQGYGEPEDKATIDYESQKERVGQWCSSLVAAVYKQRTTANTHVPRRCTTETINTQWSDSRVMIATA